MDFDFAAELPKLVQLLIGVAAFLVVVAVILVLVDRAPMRRRAWTHATILLLPALLFLTIGLVIPAVRTTLLSFMSGDGKQWVGMDNYGWMFTQPEAVTVLRNTLIWVLLVPLLVTSVGLIYAVLVDRTRFESLAKSLVFLPMAISFVGAGIIWRFVYAYRSEEQDQIGLLNQLVVAVGGEPQQWLQEPPINTLFLIVVMVWIQAGFATVVLSAAIKGIPAEIVEAAKLDGANPIQMFFRVTLPPSARPSSS